MSKAKDIAIQQQVTLEQFKGSLFQDFSKVANTTTKKVEQAIRDTGVDNINDLSKAQLRGLISKTTALSKSGFTVISEDLTKNQIKLAKLEEKFEQKYLKAITRGRNPVPVVNAYEKALVNPISATGDLMTTFTKDWGKNRTKQYNNAIRTGYINGLTTTQTISSIKGTKDANYKNGLSTKQLREGKAVINTTTQHISSTARVETLKANKDIVSGYEWVSALDGRTTQSCRGLDGQEFATSKGPVPPIHINCRSTIVPVVIDEYALDDKDNTRATKTGTVSDKESYYDWLKKQPKSFQDEAIGKGMADLLNDGTLTADQFSKISISKTFKPRTLDQMKEARDNILKAPTKAKKDIIKATNKANNVDKYGITQYPQDAILTDAQKVERYKQTNQAIQEQLKGAKVDDIILANNFNNEREDLGKWVDIFKNVIIKRGYTNINYTQLQDAISASSTLKLKAYATIDSKDGFLRFLDKFNSLQPIPVDYSLDKEVIKVLKATRVNTKVTRATLLPEKEVKNLQIPGYKAGSKALDQLDIKPVNKVMEFYNNITDGNVRQDTTSYIFKTSPKKGIQGVNMKLVKDRNVIAVMYKKGKVNAWDDATLLHEIAHDIEHENPLSLTKAMEFLQDRAKSYEDRVALSKGRLFDDDFVKLGEKDSYTSRAYYYGRDAEATEVYTRGIERLYRSPTEFYLQDREYFDIVVKGLLNLHTD